MREVDGRPVLCPTSSEGDGRASPLHGRAVVLDIEARGDVVAGVPSIVEIGAIELFDGMSTGTTLHAYCNPGAPVHPLAADIHGLTDDVLRMIPSFSDQADGIMAFVGDSPIVAHAASSDWAYLSHDLRVAGRPELPRQRFWCTQRTAMQLYGCRSIGLDGLCDLLGVDLSARTAGHGAFIDATLTASCLGVMMGSPDIERAIRASRLAPRTEPRDFRRQQPVIELHEDMVRFTLPSGEQHELTLAIPPGYSASVRRNVVLVTADGSSTPSNPDGPAVIYMSRGTLMTIDRGRIQSEVSPASPPFG